ncbi:E7 protein [Rusa timorensis papillomavirus type 2]|uniref:E7 protein n=1 Tax=Rusa timorensis papillomavirus type 2 TaxID=1905556 RepID=A0A2R2Z1A8_9PAPI|nr:E7 protein [Rusa timorensis papillomavirus type 2]AOS89495.1 E7 protein [Rusa timorensis papillomavirus type 2]
MVAGPATTKCLPKDKGLGAITLTLKPLPGGDGVDIAQKAPPAAQPGLKNFCQLHHKWRPASNLAIQRIPFADLTVKNYYVRSCCPLCGQSLNYCVHTNKTGIFSFEQLLSSCFSLVCPGCAES